ncbi:MAG TPA: DUF6800 family protein, partial [Gemmataceae bacterium]
LTPLRCVRGSDNLPYRCNEEQIRVSGTTIMVERRSELKRRYHRKKKMAKLKARLAETKSNSERETILKKIRILSPWWQEPAPQS